ncbi:MAG: hemerythrin domain-containing protein [Alphaproteobacteria bacterium]|nr:hemerythrin domain-containing protein [Alphaproteobacteria bacterium]
MAEEATLANQFAQSFRSEHRAIRDALFGLAQAFEKKSSTDIDTSLNTVASLTGPHFRYEEEALYPSLIGIFGEHYIGKLFSDHDRAIGAAKRISALAGSNHQTNEQVSEAVSLIRGILPHVSDCEGLSIMTETLPSSELAAILKARERALQQGLDLLTWSSEIRDHRV